MVFFRVNSCLLLLCTFLVSVLSISKKYLVSPLRIILYKRFLLFEGFLDCLCPGTSFVCCFVYVNAENLRYIWKLKTFFAFNEFIKSPFFFVSGLPSNRPRKWFDKLSTNQGFKMPSLVEYKYFRPSI